MSDVKSFTKLEKAVNIRIGSAVQNVAKIMCEKLKECIQEEYYDKYRPLIYNRTYKFLNSAVYDMLNGNTASIGIGDAYMDYLYPANYMLQDGSVWHWTGEDQTYMASSGFHGSAYIQRNGYYWKTFESWCDKNVVKLLKNELRKQGLHII